MYAITKISGKHGHPEFSVNADENFFEHLEWFFAWLEREVAAKKQFLPDQTIRVGWSLLKVIQREDGTLGLLEPDFKSIPIVFVDSVSKTLFHTFLQKCAAESLGLETRLDFPLLRQSAIVCADFGTNTEIFLSRTASEGADSGWFFGCTNSTHNHQVIDNLSRVSLYEAVVRLDQRIIPYLGLPSGIEILIADSGQRFSFQGKDLFIKPNSYLQKKFNPRH